MNKKDQLANAAHDQPEHVTVTARACDSDRFSAVEYTFHSERGLINVRAVIETVAEWEEEAIESIVIPPNEELDLVVFVADVSTVLENDAFVAA